MSKKKKNRRARGSSGRAAGLGDIRQKTLTLFERNANQSFNYKQIASRLGLVPSQVRENLEALLKEMANRGDLIEIGRGKYKLKFHANHVEGVVDMTSSGNAYIVNDKTEEDVLVKAGNLNHALHGDTVRVLLYARTRNKRLEGEVTEVLERKRTEFVGTVEMSKAYAFVVPDSIKMQVDLYIPKEKLNGAKHGQKVIAKLSDWPERASSPFGEITKILGEPGDHNVEIHAILAEYGLPYEFPPEVEAEAERIPMEIPESEIAKRRDMRKVTTFTIDPVDAKDFDDALSLEKLENGRWSVGIHIADVSHFVKPGSALDEEAIERATSVYLVDRVVPMLPEKLSNGVCSLRPNEDKLTFSAVFEMDEHGKVYKKWFGRTTIHSDHRFAYEDAQAIIEGGDGPLKDEILLLDSIAKQLRRDRMKAGAISFDKREVKFHLDEQSSPTGVYFKESKDANKLIEEFMLLANREVATFVGKGKDGGDSGRTMVYRVHDDPDPTKLLELSNFVKQFGYSISTRGRKAISNSLNKMLSEVKGSGEANMIETLTVRSMAKAIYTTQNVGHYGLAFDFYTHFTSPIRRYPDVIVHRILQDYLDKKSSANADAIEELCEHSTEREKMAASAERESIKYMQAKYLEKFVGEEFAGVITGVTDWGVFVELNENYCEGMIRIRDFRDDYYIYDEKNHQIIGESSGRIYQLGDPMRIRVKHVDLEKKQIDFTPLRSGSSEA
ncbi:ribonuclease R [Phaeocystidibacter luteus]|uniref:Ribonuclease R n=1 Tax=Phaeocystidibacter luteus TaxID=911197 RepID=A0A6N6RJK4_9FLAO|nr:ribonuclease R [Phaeocystidibacter luteus]KAB2813877.1 ribonuclease R [Phaeocystidibacter luteus]